MQAVPHVGGLEMTGNANRCHCAAPAPPLAFPWRFRKAVALACGAVVVSAKEVLPEFGSHVPFEVLRKGCRCRAVGPEGISGDREHLDEWEGGVVPLRERGFDPQNHAVAGVPAVALLRVVRAPAWPVKD